MKEFFKDNCKILGAILGLVLGVVLSIIYGILKLGVKYSVREDFEIIKIHEIDNGDFLLIDNYKELHTIKKSQIEYVIVEEYEADNMVFRRTRYYNHFNQNFSCKSTLYIPVNKISKY